MFQCHLIKGDVFLPVLLNFWTPVCPAAVALRLKPPRIGKMNKALWNTPLPVSFSLSASSSDNGPYTVAENPL